MDDITAATRRMTYAELEARRTSGLSRRLRWAPGQMGNGRRLLAAGAVVAAVAAVSTDARADRAVDGDRLYELCRPNSRSSTLCGD